MKKYLFLFISSFMILVACNTSKKEKIDVASIKIKGVSLNEKDNLWKANKETTDGIFKMQKMVNSFNENSNLKAYTALKNQLESTFQEIFSKCTMKGAAHEQLHNYLKPMIGYFENLESANAATRKENLKKLTYHLLGYSNYFE